MIMRISEFLTQMERYFGGFPNETVKGLYAEELAYVKPADFAMLFRYIITHNPAAWKPDVKALLEALKSCKIDMLNDPAVSRICPVCKKENPSNGVCPTCKYDGGVRDGTPDEYRAFWEDWKRGAIPRFDWSSVKVRRVD